MLENVCVCVCRAERGASEGGVGGGGLVLKHKRNVRRQLQQFPNENFSEVSGHRFHLFISLIYKKKIH